MVSEVHLQHSGRTRAQTELTHASENHRRGERLQHIAPPHEHTGRWMTCAPYSPVTSRIGVESCPRAFIARLRSSTNPSFCCAFASSPVVHSRTLSGVSSGRETSPGRGFPHPHTADALRTSSYIGVAAGVCGRAASPLPLGERGDQLAAEGRGVGRPTTVQACVRWVLTPVTPARARPQRPSEALWRRDLSACEMCRWSLDRMARGKTHLMILR